MRKSKGIGLAKRRITMPKTYRLASAVVILSTWYRGILKRVTRKIPREDDMQK
jgi:hypothetical protein